MRKQALIINVKDNVAVVFEKIIAGEEVSCIKGCEELVIISKQDIPVYHKISIIDIRQKEAVIKYGESIGYANFTITKGEHVHVHNLGSSKI